MTFRSPEHVQRNELVRFQLQDNLRTPNAGQEQQKRDYKFLVNDRSSFYDWYNAFFKVQFQLDLKADEGEIADTDVTMINGSHSLIKHMVVRSSEKIIYDTDNLHKVTFVKNLLEYSDDYSRSVAKNSFWYLHTNDSTQNTNLGYLARKTLTQGRNAGPAGPGKEVNVTIPLNRYSFFETLEGKLLPPLQLKIEIELTPDAKLLYGAVDTGRLIINRFYLWVPRLEPKDSLMTKFISEFQKPSRWTNLRELYISSANTRQGSGDFRISPSIDRVKHVFVYAQRANNSIMTENPYIFDTFKLNAGNNNSSLTTCRLEYGNGTFYPEYSYESDSKSRIFSDLINYSWKKNDYNTGTQLSVSNFSSIYPLIYFDLTYQEDRPTRDPKKLNLKYTMSAPGGDIQFHAVVLYEEDIVIDKVGDQLLIV